MEKRCSCRPFHSLQSLFSVIGKNNQHSGNNQLRAFAKQECKNYRISSKKGKSYISRELVQKVRELDPPGRFLKKNGKTGLWEDVGDEVAREKASQALRDAVAVVLSEEQDDEEEEVEEEQVQPLPASQAFRRTQSAPPIMDKSPTDERRKTWPVQEQRRTQERERDTPQYPPVTPRSATSAAKRRRFYEEANSPWMYQPEQPPYTTPDFSTSRSNPEFLRRQDYYPPQQYPSQQYPTQHARRGHRQHHPGATYSGGTEVEDEFDLFNGQLLEPGEEETSLERRSDTF